LQRKEDARVAKVLEQAGTPLRSTTAHSSRQGGASSILSEVCQKFDLPRGKVAVA